MRGWQRDLANDLYAEGRKAFKGGMAKTDNPYDPAGAPRIRDAAYRWYAGWEDARDDAEASQKPIPQTITEG